MIKVRMQGTKREIRWFLKLLKRDSRFRLENTSAFFNNKGPDRYKRLYTEVHRKKESQEPHENRGRARTQEYGKTKRNAYAPGRAFGNYGM